MSDIEQRIEAEIRASLEPRLATAKTRQEKTRETATLLFFTYGIHPSAKVVREYTNHGSIGDISKDLHAFWADLRKSKVRISAPIPDDLVALYSEGLSSVWETAVAKANATMDSERQEAAAKVAEAKGEAEESNRMRLFAEERAERNEQELRQERQQRAEAETLVATQSTEIDALQEAVRNGQEQAQREAQARQEAEERFSKDLEAERTARARDTEMLEGQVKFATLQIEEARAKERELRQQIKEEQARKEGELTAYRQRASLAEEALSQAKIETAEWRGRAEEIDRTYQALRRDLAHKAVAIAPSGIRRKLRPVR